MTRAKDISKIVTDADLSGTLDVTGAVTAGGLTMDTGGNSTHTLEFGANRTSDSQALGIIRGSWNGTVVSQINLSAGHDTTNKDNGQIFFRTAGEGTTVNRLQIEENGDISFYEDTGTTPKMVWSASAETLNVDGVVTVDRVINATTSSDPWLKGVNGSNTETFFLKPSGQAYFGSNVGIGTDSPSDKLHVDGSGAYIRVNRTDGEAGITLMYNGSNSTRSNISTLTNGDLQFETANTERMRITSAGNVGINDSGPEAKLHISENASGATYPILLQNRTNSNSSVGIRFIATGSDLGDGQFASIEAIGDTASNTRHHLAFKTVTSGGTPAERMRITDGGNVGIGINSNPVSQSGTTDGGQYFVANSYSAFARVGGVVSYFNRQYSAGEIVQFRSDGSSVGNIGVNSVYLYIGTPNASLLKFDNAKIIPANNNGDSRDNAIDLGVSTSRFDDIFATNGTIQTSDRNEKQDIEELSEAEQRVAVVAKGLMRKFRWIDSVAEKGDNARTHFGIIAQDLQDAFTAEGLDAGDYAMFTSNTWWEKEISVDAVEADEENGIEAKDAYTYMDTKEEATEGYTERTRLGVRYNQLLAFIISAI